jgi:hypothetical protein
VLGNSTVRITGRIGLGREDSESDDCQISFVGPLDLLCNSTNGSALDVKLIVVIGNLC